MEIFRKSLDKIQGKERINELLYYNVEDERLFIHLDEKRGISPLKKLSIYRAGLSTLAHELTTNEHLKGINFVIAGSWIVKSQPSLLRRFGFTVFDKASDRENIEDMRVFGITGMRHGITKDTERLAAMSKDDFLKRPWEKRF